MLNKNLKKLISIIMLMLVSLSLVACGSSSTARTSNVKKVIESQAQNEAAAPKRANSSQMGGNSSSMQKPSSARQVQLDLTSLSSTVADAQLQKLQNNKEAYRGLVVKAKGEYSYFKDQETGLEYYNCVFASSCCPNGLEFVLSDSSKYPTEEGELITIIGEFDYYEENSLVYYTLVNASIV